MARSSGRLPQPVTITIRTYEQFSELYKVLMAAGLAGMMSNRQNVLDALAPIAMQLKHSQAMRDWDCGDPDCEACAEGRKSKSPQLALVSPTEGDA
jgi:hypothetical protein